jgi:serine protease
MANKNSRWIPIAASTLSIALLATGSTASEYAPVRKHPAAAESQTGVQHIIVKLRAASVTATTSGRVHTMATEDRVAALATRAGLTLKESHEIATNMHVMHVEPAVTGESVTATLARLRADPEVEYAEPDQRRFPHAAPNDPLYPGQWYMQNSVTTPSAVDAVTAWDTTTGSTGLVIADLDTGIRFEHPDLQWAGSGGRVLPGYDFISDPFVANDGDGRDADPSDPGDWVTSADLKQPQCSGETQTSNSSWHGTRTAGILGALTNNSDGIAGMTWSAWLLPVRVLGKCGGSDSDILSAMLWAAGIPVSGVPNNPYPAKIENMSLGAAGACPQSYQDVINQLTARGVLVVVSAGNEGGPVDSPANCPGVAGIAGLRHAGTKVGYSSLGPEIALSAPAGNCVNTSGSCLYSIDTTFNLGITGPTTNSYTDQTNTNLGTSFSAPIVAGIAGLMLSVNGNLKSAQLIARLQEGATKPFPSNPAAPGGTCHVPSGPNDVQTSECNCTTSTCGAGMANAAGALAAALRPIAAVKLPANVTPGSSVTLDGSGSGAACNHSLAADQWVSSDPTGHPVSSPNGQSTTVTAPVAGSFTVTLTVTDDAGRTDSATVTINPTSATTGAPAAAGASACLAAIAVPSPVTASIAPSSASVQAGGSTQSFTASVTHTLNTAVTWEVNGIVGGNATVGTISTAGLYSPPASAPSPAAVTVTAVSVADPSRFASAQVTITSATSTAKGTGSGGGGGAIGLELPLWLFAYWAFNPRRGPRWLRHPPGGACDACG